MIEIIMLVLASITLYVAFILTFGLSVLEYLFAEVSLARNMCAFDIRYLKNGIDIESDKKDR
jgi:hypothetical protein